MHDFETPAPITDAQLADPILQRPTDAANAAGPEAPRPYLPAALAASLALEACSGSPSGGSSGPTGVTPTPAPGPAPITGLAASRFLAQASFGATQADISSVQSLGFDGWITDQIARPRTAHWDWLVAGGFAAANFANTQQGFDNSVWRQMIAEPGQLRQRVGIALSELFVVGIDGVIPNFRAFSVAAWLDILLDNAFGNFRTLMEQITMNAAMASYLTFLGNRRANARTGSVPDENYARELMQLFTIGLIQLNMDGSPRLAGGEPIDTYSQTDVSQLARVFTGLNLDSSDSSTPDRYRRPLVINATFHETGASSFLGASVPAGTDGAGAIRIALDTIFAHPNVPPFVSRHLIQRLVTSNPSAGYIGRVAAVFADNGSGVRGDLRAVVRAILLDSEARTPPSAANTNAGKLREPVVRFTNWARAFGATSPGGTWPIGDTSSSTTRLAQSIGRSPSVFNFFRPGYSPPNTALSAAGLVAPEFQLTNELSVVGYVNFMQTVIQSGVGDVRADYSDALTRAADSQALVDNINLVVAAGQLSAATIASIRSAVDSIAFTATNGPINRVYTAILLAMASPEYITLK